MLEDDSLSPVDVALPDDMDSITRLPVGMAGVFSFTFQYQEAHFSVACTEDLQEGDATLKVTSDLGGVPPSAEDPTVRLGVIHVIASANEALGRTLFCLEQDRVGVAFEVKVPRPITSIALMAALAEVLMQVAPYVALIEGVKGP